MCAAWRPPEPLDGVLADSAPSRAILAELDTTISGSTFYVYAGPSATAVVRPRRRRHRHRRRARARAGVRCRRRSGAAFKNEAGLLLLTLLFVREPPGSTCWWFAAYLRAGATTSRRGAWLASGCRGPRLAAVDRRAQRARPARQAARRAPGWTSPSPASAATAGTPPGGIGSRRRSSRGAMVAAAERLACLYVVYLGQTGAFAESIAQSAEVYSSGPMDARASRSSRAGRPAAPPGSARPSGTAVCVLRPRSAALPLVTRRARVRGQVLRELGRSSPRSSPTCSAAERSARSRARVVAGARVAEAVGADAGAAARVGRSRSDCWRRVVVLAPRRAGGRRSATPPDPEHGAERVGRTEGVRKTCGVTGWRTIARPGRSRLPPSARRG